jgi:hypothetical protein
MPSARAVPSGNAKGSGHSGRAANAVATLPSDLVATDSEWDTTRMDSWVSMTFATNRRTVVCLRDDLSMEVRSRLGAAAGDRRVACSTRSAAMVLPDHSRRGPLSP